MTWGSAKTVGNRERQIDQTVVSRKQAMFQSSRSVRLTVVCFFLLISFAVAQDGSSLADKIRKIKSRANPQTSSQSEAAHAENPAYQKILKGVALIAVEDGRGTGWVLDVDKRLLVTNQHVIEGFEDCVVYFPQFENGRLVTSPETLTPNRGIPGRVVDSVADSDLALVQLQAPFPKSTRALPLADASASPGQNVHSIAGHTIGSDSLWTYSTGHVRQIVRGVLANGYEATVLESDMATNQGNSGGPVCNDQGEIVAVVEGHSTQARLISIYVELTSLAEYLGDALRCVDPTSFEDIVFAADRHLDEGRTATAAKLATNALKLQPNSADAMSLRGWCWYDDNDLDSAEADFQEALKHDSTFADAHCGLGFVEDDREKYDAAIKHFTNAIRNAPETRPIRTIAGKLGMQRAIGTRRDKTFLRHWKRRTMSTRFETWR